MQQYKSFCQVIIIHAINNFTIYKIFYIYSRISFNKYKYHTTNNFERLIEEESLKITFIIKTLILTIIGICIGPTRISEADAPEVIFDTDGKIQERLVIIEKICAKLIFSR